MTTQTIDRPIGRMETSDLEDLLDAATLAGFHGNHLRKRIERELNQRALEASLPAYEG